ncbi:terminase small subunit [Methylobacterium gnaphalii]|uniref:Terminase small subunit n=1 Tax=Methylobacterium gnaphalii TaxID=1010610 RepID=A0A512JIX3_9HYPH|nr:terminase small subunit [Methylobacterium gnaphalii]GEP09822.1 hypothetical protein MGN01_16670 [Methylobacterium gnaphalii]GJD67263.1 hypothetical protein MMMDOFMJ_0177 [Methylobacterium gnaphalii]GLS49852.1 hypothetical protein GCM10007885_27040 [Methylobacterium gnaphalii]
MTGAPLEGRPINRGDLASLCGVSLPTVDSWVEKGCPYVERGSKGVEWKFDSAAVIDWRIQRAVENAVSGAGEESTKGKREEADTRRAVANAIVAEISADEALKAVVSRHDVVADMATFCQVLKTGLSNMASKVAARATTMTNASEIEAMAQSEMNRAFTAARDDIAQRWFAGRDPTDEGDGADRPPSER